MLSKASQLLQNAHKQHDQADYQTAIQTAEEVVVIFEKENNWEQVVNARNLIGACYMDLEKNDTALQHLLQTKEIAHQYLPKNHPQIALNFSYLGSIYGLKGNTTKQLFFLKKGIATFTQNEATHPFSDMLYNSVGICLIQKGDYNEALYHYQKALQIRLSKGLEKHYHTAIAYNNIGQAYAYKGDIDQAIFFFKKGLEGYPQTIGNQHPNIGYVYVSLGTCFDKKGEETLASSYYQQAAAIFIDTFGEQHPMVAESYQHIAITYRKKQAYSESLSYYQKARDILYQTVGKKDFRVYSLYRRLAFLYGAMGDRVQQYHYYQKNLVGTLALRGEKHPFTADAYRNIGACYIHKHDWEKAMMCYQKSIDIYSQTVGLQHPNTARTFFKMGQCMLQNTHYEQALYYFQESLQSLSFDLISSDIYQILTLQNYNSSPQLLDTLSAKASTFYQYYTTQSHNLQDLNAALQNYQLAVALINQMRQSYRTQDSQLALSAKAKTVYAATIQIAMKMEQVAPNDYHALAFQVSEKAKASILLTAVQEHIAQSLTDVPAELLEQEKQLKIELSYLEKSIQKEQAKASEKQDPELLKKWQNQFFDYQEQYLQLLEKIENDYPDYYHLKYDVEVVAPIQVQLFLKKIMPQSALVSYFIAESELYIFYISPAFFELKIAPRPTNFEQLVADFTESIDTFSRKTYLRTAFELHELLIAPLQAILRADKAEHLVIIPDQSLHYLPFEALLTETVNTRSPFADLPYLLLQYDISYHHSASLLLYGDKRKRTTQASKDFLGFAPVYADQHLPQNGTQNADSYSTNTTRSVQIGDREFKALLYSEKEVKDIEHLFEQHQLSAVSYLHEAAHKSHFLKKIMDYQYVLIAAHGLYNPDHPQLSGILFSPNPHKKTSETDDPMLYISDTYHLNLHADLVVLSACESGLGRLAKGEGMMSMNRGLLYAGASNVVFTLFKVYDQASCRLTHHLFEGILEGKSYVRALGDAKRMLIQEAKTLPKFWCGFVLLGH